MKPIILFLALALALVGCGCAAKTAPVATVSSASVSSAESSASEKPLNLVAGNSLEMLGYEINIPNDIILSNNLPLSKYSNEMFNHYGIINYDDLLGGEKKYTLVCAVLAIPKTYTGERRTFMCLQAFAPADVNTENAVKIGEETYPFEALKPFLIFENDDIVVYDIYSIIDGESLQDQIEAAVTQFNEAVKKTMSLPDGSKMLRGEPRPTEADLVNASDFDYLLEVEEYYRTNLKAMIVKQAPLTTQIPSEIQEQSRAEYVKPQESTPKKAEEDVPVSPAPSELPSHPPPFDSQEKAESGRPEIGRAEYELWKIEIAKKYNVSNFSEWQDSIYQMELNIQEALGEEIYGSIDKITIPFEEENNLGIEGCAKGYNIYSIDEQAAKKVVGECLSSYDNNLGPIEINIIPCDFDFKTLSTARTEIMHQPFWNGKIVKGIGIEKAKILISAYNECHELEEYLHANDYGKYVTLIKSNSVPTGDFTENKYKKSALSDELLTKIPSNGQLISLTDEPYADAFAPVASKAEELLTGSHVFIRYLYIIDKNGAPVQNIVCFTPYQWKIINEKNTEHWISATSLSSGITPMNFPKNGKQNSTTQLVLVNMDSVGKPLALTVTVNLSKLDEKNAQVVIWNQETPHDSAAKHSDVLEITVKKPDGTPAVDFEVNLNEFSVNEYGALHIPRFTDASGKVKIVLSKAIDPSFLKIPNAQTVIRIYDSWYFGASRNYLHDLYNDDELIKSRELVFPPAVEDLIEFEENPWNNPD